MLKNTAQTVQTNFASFDFEASCHTLYITQTAAIIPSKNIKFMSVILSSNLQIICHSNFFFCSILNLGVRMLLH